MGELKNVKWERFARLTAVGKTRHDAYWGAGYQSKSKRVASSRGSTLYCKMEIQGRVSELEEEIRKGSIEAAQLSREFVIEELKENIVMAKGHKPVLDRSGQETGEYKADLGAANRGLELLGKELGMFRDRLDVHNLDHELGDMTGDQLRAFVASASTEVGLRVVGMSDDETRAYIRRNAARVGLRVVDSSGQDLEGTSDEEDGAVSAVSEATGVPPTRH